MDNIILANLKPNEAATMHVIEALFQYYKAQHVQLKDYNLVWNTSKRCLGFARPGKKQIEISIFHLSGNVLEVKDTLIHECAHIIVGCGHKHDMYWRAVAIAMGGTGKRTGDLGMDSTRYIGTCPVCGAKFYKHRPKKNLYHPCMDNKTTKTKLTWSVNK